MRSRYWVAPLLLAACALSNSQPTKKEPEECKAQRDIRTQQQELPNGQALSQAISKLESAIAKTPNATPKDRAHKIRLSIDISKLLVHADRRLDATKVLAPILQSVSAAKTETGSAEAELFEAVARLYLDLEVFDLAEQLAFVALGTHSKFLTKGVKTSAPIIEARRLMTKVALAQARYEEALVFGIAAYEESLAQHGQLHEITLDVVEDLTKAAVERRAFRLVEDVLEPAINASTNSPCAFQQLQATSLLRRYALSQLRQDNLEQALALIERSDRLIDSLGLRAFKPFENSRARGVILGFLGRYQDAISVLEPYVESLKSGITPKQILVRHEVVGTLAAMYGKAGRIDDSTRLLETLYKEQNAQKDSKDISILNTIFNLWVIYANGKRFEVEPGLFKELAFAFVHKAEQFKNRLGLSVSDRRALAGEHLGAYRMFAYGLGGGHLNDMTLPSSGQDLVGGFELVDLSKGRSLWETVIAKRALREAGIEPKSVEKMQSLLDSLQKQELRRALLDVSVNTPDRAKAYNSVRQLLAIDRREVAELETEFLGSYPKYALLREYKVPSVKALAPSLIKNDELFISYSFDSSGLLFAWLVDSSGQIEFVDLGTPKDLNQKIARFRDLISGVVAGRSRQQLATAGAEMLALRKDISEALIKPLEGRLKGKTRLIISPDGALGMLAFDWLELAGEPLIKHFSMSMAQSWTIFAMLKAREAEYRRQTSAKILFAMGNPKYEAARASESSRSASEPLLRGARLSASSVSDTRPASAQADEPITEEREAELIRNLRWASLPGTGVEIDRVSALFPASAGVTIFTGEKASESNLHGLNKSGELAKYRYLLFASHGALAPDPSLSSLVLTHESNADYWRDGYLTANELEGYQLRSELTVLSACDTGVGDPVPGEGLLGLPFSLFVAGNLNTLMTLWPISDSATAEFMARFFKRLSSGEPQAYALAAVKREFATHALYSHPKYWAGFVLNGV